MNLVAGMEHSVQFVCCECEPLSVTLVRAQLWPSSPQQPRIAFSFKLLDWAEALLLECQVPVKDFCSALYFRCPHLITKVCNKDTQQPCLFCTLQRKEIYRSLIDSFEEYRQVCCSVLKSQAMFLLLLYRYMRHELRHLFYISEDLDQGNVCPACPKV